jgi:hypothetical protein
VKWKPILEFEMGRSLRFPFRVFHSAVPYKDGYIGVLREFDPFLPFSRTDLHLVQHNAAGKLIGDELLCHGEDPRVFSYHGLPHVFSWSFDNGVWSHFIIDLAKRRKISLASEVNGKNFVPVQAADNADDFYMIQSICPFVLAKLNFVTATLELATGDPELIATDKPFGPWRGGASAIAFNNCTMEGYGYKSEAADRHIPFHFKKSFEGKAFTRIEVADGFNTCGINEPTSFWMDDEGDDNVIICRTEHRWSIAQPVESVLYRVTN